MAKLGFVFDAMAHQSASNLTVALDLAKAGVFVFPCKQDKTPLSGVYWRSASTTDERRIKAWWRDNADALVAIDCGKSDFLVIDADGPEGVAQWQDVRAERDPYSPTVESPRGGVHHYYRQDPCRLHGNGRGALPPKLEGGAGIDVRGVGGYVIAPGSTLIDGRRYEPNDDDILSASVAPDWLLDILEGPAARPEKAPPADPVRIHPRALDADQENRRLALYGQAALDLERERVATCGKGARNETLNRAAFALGTIVGSGWLLAAEVEAYLMEAATACGLVAEDGQRKCLATIRSGLNAGRKSPRLVPDGNYAVDAEIGAAYAASILANARRVRVDDNGEVLDADTGEILTPEPAPAEDTEMPAHLARPPGLVGALVDWICDTARRPSRPLAIGAALTVVGTAAGRHLAGPTGSGTHLYVVGLAPTGAGKDHALQAIMAALVAVEAPHLIGPSQFISMPAVINFLVRSPLSVCAMDEFGAFLKRINSRKASGFEGAISGILRTAWGASFKPMPTPEWAGRAAELIVAPALSIYGVSTAEEFYGSLEGADTSNGVLNRMLVIETGVRPKDRAPRLKDRALPGPIEGGLRSILHRGGSLVYAQLGVSDRAPPVETVPWGGGAEAAYIDMVEDIYRTCDADRDAHVYYARAAEMAVRLATILAVGVNPVSPVVDLDAFLWARDFTLWCCRNLHRAGNEHIADTDTQSATNAVRRAIREAGGTIKHRDLLRKLNYRLKNRDLHEIIRALVEGDQIACEKVPAAGGGAGRPSVRYTLLK